MAATPKRVVVDVEPRIQVRVGVRLMAQDAATARVLDGANRGPFSMSPRTFAPGDYIRVEPIGTTYYRVGAVIHDANEPTTVTLVVSVSKQEDWT